MFYYTTNRPRQVSYEHLGRILLHGTNFLDLKGVTLNVVFDDLDEEGFVAGYTDYDDEEEEIQITIQKRLWKNREAFLLTIFHELVHAKQIADGRLVLGLPSRWNGEPYDVYYQDLPWEIEAYALEKQMFKLYEETC